MIAAAATVLTLFLAKQTAADEYVLINTASELAQLATNVNSYYGSSYYGTTVFLNADLDFDGVSFSPIGTGSSYNFRGVFDGQGHTISNLNFLGSGNYVGLFGYSSGTTIRNVVLDSSCSFESTTSYNAYTGGILGHSGTTYGKVTIDNCVNMASVSHNKHTSTISNIGGIVGYHYYWSYPISITNCANFGKVTRTTTYDNNYIGGIAGRIYGSSSYKASIVNCANYGTVSAPSSSGSQNYMGGIVGYSRANEIRNCLSVGEIQIPSDATAYVGSITGYSENYNWMSIEHCVWSSGITGRDGFGVGVSYLNVSDCYDVKTVNETTMDDMNDYVTDGSKWVLSENYPVSLEVSGRKAIVYNANAILLFNNFKNAFWDYSGWYTDSDCQNLLDSSFVTQTTLYGKVATAYFTATFVFWRGYSETKSYKYGDTIELPTTVPEREYSTFIRWESEYKTMPAQDITITAVWDSVPYYVTFDLNNGEEPIVEIYSYNETIEYPDVPRLGYKLLGWDNYVEYMPAENITVTAQWEVIYYTATFIFWDDINETKTYKYGDTVRKPLVIPERENYVFDGWNSKYETMPPKDITITAKWKVIKYQMIFNLSYGEDPIVEKFYEYNDTVEYPDVEPRTGYEFVEWDKNITNMPAENVTVTALWKVIDYTLVFYDEDSQKVIESHTLHYEDIIPYPSVTRENYRFKSWNYTRSKMPASNLTITVEWEKIPTDRVDVTLLGTLDKDGIVKAAKEYTDANIVVLTSSVSNNKTTATIVFEDVYQAQEFVETVEREMAVGVDSAVGPKVVCDYNYSGEKKPHRPGYESGAVSLVMSAAALLFIF